MSNFRSFRRKMAQERKIEDPMEKFAITCYIHFGEQNPSSISCETCTDYKMGICPGQGLRGDGCLVCMSKHSGNMIMENNGRIVFSEIAG